MIFGRSKRSPALEILSGAEWRCVTCGEQHRGMFDLAAHAPDFWDGPDDYEANGALQLDGNFLSEDFCVLGGEHFFVRCVFEIPVHGLDQKFGFGCWSTLSRSNFELYVDNFDQATFAGHGPWSGWFSNQLKGFPAESVGQGCWVLPQLGRQRPVIALMDQDHPLARAQAEGVEPEFILSLYAANGHPVVQS